MVGSLCATFTLLKLVEIMQLSGPLKKMSTQYGPEVRYTLSLGTDLLLMNGLIGKSLRMTFTGTHKCFCGQLVPEVYRQNFCRECFFTKPEASPTIMKPELSKAHLGIAERDLEFEQRLQLQPHLVYLAKTDRIKVGVTRKTQMPYRWMDQGADEAIIILEVPNRYLAGVAEVALKDHFTDKTSWQAMLKGATTEESLEEAFKLAQNSLPQEVLAYKKDGIDIWSINYPVTQHPSKVKSMSFKSEGDSWEGELVGIKGQYLITTSGVFNVRAHEGHIVNLELL